MQKRVAQKTFYSTHVFMPNDLIKCLNDNKLDIDVDSEISGQANSLFNNIVVEISKAGKTMKVRPRIKGIKLKLATSVKPADADAQFKRQNLDKITLDVNDNCTYVTVDKDTKNREIQCYGESMKLYSEKYKEKLTYYNSQKKLMHNVKKVYTPHKTHFESKTEYDDDGNPLSIERTTAVISHSLTFDKQTYLPTCKVLNLQGEPLTMEIEDENGNTKKIGFNAHTAHLFLGKGSEVTFIADNSSMSRTASGRGYTAKLFDVYINPKPYVPEGIDEDDLALARGDFDEDEQGDGNFANNMADKLK